MSWSVRRRALPVVAAGVLVTASALAACGGDKLTSGELREFDRLSKRLYALCERRAPLEGSERAPAYRVVSRLMDLTSKAPHQRWVVDPDDDSTGTTTPASALQYVSEFLGTAEERGGPLCDPYESGRIDQFLSAVDSP